MLRFDPARPVVLTLLLAIASGGAVAAQTGPPPPDDRVLSSATSMGLDRREGPPASGSFADLRPGDAIRVTAGELGLDRATATVAVTGSGGLILFRDGEELVVPFDRVDEAWVAAGERSWGIHGAAAGALVGALAGFVAARGSEDDPSCFPSMTPPPPPGGWFFGSRSGSPVEPDCGRRTAGQKKTRSTLVGAGVGAVLGLAVGASIRTPVWRPLARSDRELTLRPAWDGGPAVRVRLRF